LVVDDKGRRESSRIVTRSGSLDLDHVSTKVAEQLRAIRPGEDAREVDDGDTGKGAFVLGHGKS
jgi:hypothetical protein